MSLYTSYKERLNGRAKLLAIPVVIFVWYMVYGNLYALSEFITYRLLGLEEGAHFTESLKFLIYEVPKVLMLLVLIIFFVGIIRSYFTAERTRKALEGKSLFAGNVLASLLGVVTPFCTCSAIPLFIGFVQAGVPLGVTFSFLIASPMINEVAIVLLLSMFGIKVTAIYIATGLTLAIISGFIIGKLKPGRFVQDWVYQMQSAESTGTEEKLTFSDRINSGITAVKEIVGKVWIYIVLGIAVGAGVHGYVPENYLAGLMGEAAWYSVPLSILIGVPLYSNAAGIIPIVSVLLSKGVPLGTALAFMMAVIGLSLPEMIILKKVLKIRLIMIFVCTVTIGIVIVGYLFNYFNIN